MITSVGTSPEGYPLVLVGLTPSDLLGLIESSPPDGSLPAITVASEHIDPRVTPVRVVITGGTDDVTMRDAILARWPDADVFAAVGEPEGGGDDAAV